MIYNFASDRFHTKKVCSSEMQFYSKNGHCVFEPLWGLKATYAAHLRHIGKRVVIIELSCYSWGATSECQVEVDVFEGIGHFDTKFHVEWDVPHQPFFMLEKYMVSECGQKFLSFCHKSSIWRTDGSLVARPRLHSCSALITIEASVTFKSTWNDPILFDYFEHDVFDALRCVAENVECVNYGGMFDLWIDSDWTRCWLRHCDVLGQCWNGELSVECGVAKVERLTLAKRFQFCQCEVEGKPALNSNLITKPTTCPYSHSAVRSVLGPCVRNRKITFFMEMKSNLEIDRNLV